MSNRTKTLAETATETAETGTETAETGTAATTAKSPADVVRELYEALRKGDVPGVLERLAHDVVVDEPAQLPYGGVHQGREVFARSVLGTMTGLTGVAIAEAEVFEGPSGVVGRLTGTLTAHTTGEVFPLTVVEVHRVEDGTVREIDVFVKEPAELAAFYARASRGDLGGGSEDDRLPTSGS